MNVYLLQLRGLVDVEELNTMSPHQMTTLQREPTATLFWIHTDQSGMIGMIQHLHNLGFSILSVVSQPEGKSISDGSTEARRIVP